MDLKISVIICTLDNYSGISSLFESISKQYLKPEEILVIQGGKNKKITETVNYWNELLNIIYVESQKSLVTQRNKGLELAKGDIICFLDDDVILEGNYFESILNSYTKDVEEKIGGIQGTILNIPKMNPVKKIFNELFLIEDSHGNGKLKKSGSPSFHRPSLNNKNVEVFNGCQMTFRNSIIKELQFDSFFNENWLGDDFEGSFNVSRHKSLLQIPEAKLYHNGNASFNHSTKIAFMIGRNYPYIRDKHNLNKGLGKIYCLWSDIGRVFYYFLLGIKFKSFDFLYSWFQGRKSYYESKKNIVLN